MSFLFNIQVEKDRPNTDQMLRTGERIKHFNIFLPGVGFIPCLTHITCKRHSWYLFLYRGYALGVRGYAGAFYQFIWNKYMCCTSKGIKTFSVGGLELHTC